MKKIIFVIITICLSITLISCNKKKAVINLCCVDYNNVYDNYTGIDIIDEGCKFADVEKWIIKCNVNDIVNVKVNVYEGYYIKTCYYNSVYTLDNASTLTVKNNSVEVKALNTINYVIFDIVPNEA